MMRAITYMLNWEIFDNKKIILLYQIASAVLIGVCGTILVTMFLATFLPISKVVNFIPWLIGLDGFGTAQRRPTFCHDQILDRCRNAIKAAHWLAPLPPRLGRTCLFPCRLMIDQAKGIELWIELIGSVECRLHYLDGTQRLVPIGRNQFASAHPMNVGHRASPLLAFN